MVDQPEGVWFPASAQKPTEVGFFVWGHLTNVPLCAVAGRFVFKTAAFVL